MQYLCLCYYDTQQVSSKHAVANYGENLGFSIEVRA